jgi:predicted Zn-dependent protease
VREINLLLRGSGFLGRPIVFFFLLTSCSTRASIPTVSDYSVELFVRREAAQIVAVSEDQDHFSDYQIYLSDFPRKDILGMSIGKRRIYISHRLAKSASNSSLHLWLLRQTLAHEIAHETAGHADNSESTWFNRSTLGRGVTGRDLGLPGNVRFRNYSAEKELEADAKGLGYWQKLGWDCGIWVRILQSFEKQNYAGDIFHPTAKRLLQARRACVSEEINEVI